MLNENIRTIRKSKGLSQEEFAVRLNVVRQTVSKWERGLSVPDSDMLIAVSEALDTPVSVLLGETVAETEADSLKAIAEKLEVINLQLARKREASRKAVHLLFILLCAAVALGLIIIAAAGSPYLSWNYSDPETAVAGTFLHAAEWAFVRIAPFALSGSAAGIILTRRRK